LEKKTTIIITTFLLIFNYAFLLGQYKRTDLQNENLFGEVKSIKYYSYENEADTKEIILVLKFNKQGDIIEQIRYRIDSDIIDHYVYMLDKKNNKIEIHELDSNEEVKHKYIYKNKYSNNGDIIEAQEFNNEGILKATIFFAYTKNDSTTTVEKKKLGKDRSHQYHALEKYNNDHKLIESIWFSEDGIIDSKALYKHDNMGNVIKESYSIGRYPENDRQYVNSYEFDRKKNWIKKIQKSEGVINDILEREISYYK